MFTYGIQDVSKLMRNILKGDFSTKSKRGLSYNFLVENPFPSMLQLFNDRGGNCFYLIRISTMEEFRKMKFVI